MASPFSSDIPKPFGTTEKVVKDVNRAFALPVPAFGDLSKAANDLINKDFYHTAQATLDVKLKAPNGTNVNVKGKQGFDGVTNGSIEGKHVLKPQGTRTPPPGFIKLMQTFTSLPAPYRTHLYLFLTAMPSQNARAPTKHRAGLICKHPTGVTVTQLWTTASLLDTKIELADVANTGVKVDLQNLWNPSKPNSAAQKLNLAFKNPSIHSRAFINYGLANGNLDAVVDVTAGHEGFLVGGEAGYDVQKAAVTRYSLGLGYQTPAFTASIVGTQNLSVIAASYYQKVNSAVEVGTKAAYDVQGGKPAGLELASKYKLDPLSFAKVKINDRGIAALAYSTKLNAGTTLGLGLSLDTAKLNEAGHKIGTSLTFEATTSEIKKQFYKLSKSYHPDLHPEKPNAKTRFLAISEAYTVLSSPTKRPQYDRNFLRATGPQTTSPATGSPGGRPASGLSKRRSTFRGPPPSFHRSGGWGSHTQKRAEAASQPSHSHPAASMAPGTGPGSTAAGHGVPHFDHEQHTSTHSTIERTRHQARRQKFERRMEQAQEDVQGGSSALVNFLLVGGILGVVFAVPAVFFSGGRESGSGKKRGDG
ncbi:hypothetical protein B0A48_09057 [Cryoendolithus antarcticus]|uniref:J domain-containing protein n=1 Tax=Cryoendolithus antarcticus TaxID=1507870 RepID=A0A1V8T1T5_9PEZI|nr:hypothetical protein B0A48_09057 [Cryoendolithus antarcticus]